MKRIITLVFLVLLAAFVSAGDKPEYKSTIDYIEKTGRLWGIAEVKVNADKSIALVDAESGYGSGLMLSLSEVQTSATLKVDESCTLSDGDHAFIKYEFKKLEDGKISILVTDAFDARSFGGEVKTETKKVVIKPYAEEKKTEKDSAP